MQTSTGSSLLVAAAENGTCFADVLGLAELPLLQLCSQCLLDHALLCRCCSLLRSCRA